MNAIRSIAELTDVADPAWPLLIADFGTAAVSVQVLPVNPSVGAEVLHRLQVTARSPLGALALNCGGVLVDDGWLRMLGGGYEGLPDLATASGMGNLTEASGSPGSVTVAYDVLGGEFAINGGALPGNPGEVCYFGPDSLTWSPIGGGHTAFVEWAISGGLEEFYGDLRWPGWRDEVRSLKPGQALTLYPPLWSAEGRQDVGGTARGPASLAEVLAYRDATVQSLADLPDGASVHMRTSGEG